jgi:hypothetical protein
MKWLYDAGVVVCLLALAWWMLGRLAFYSPDEE